MRPGMLLRHRHHDLTSTCSKFPRHKGAAITTKTHGERKPPPAQRISRDRSALAPTFAISFVVNSLGSAMASPAS
jgi:hypothetical protein